MSSPRGELRFAPEGALVDRRGRRWSVEGEHEALDLTVGDDLVTSSAYCLRTCTTPVMNGCTVQM